MLILTRKRSETIQIGDTISIKVIKTGRSTVKIGVTAPSNVRVLRGELCDETVEARKGDVIDVESPGGDAALTATSDQFPHPHIA